ncbi:peptidoglycan-binding protein [Mesorhizobium sp. BH1-1-4]|nr:peptidoglycan-binding protein [Mesorhizobium sp. BH1-1-4]
MAVALAAVLNVADTATAQDSRYSARQIQQALAEHGYDLGTADGIWGRRSISALKAFQKASNLPQSGTLDAATSATLFPQPQVTRGPLTPIATDAHLPPPTQPGVPTKTTPQANSGGKQVAMPPRRYLCRRSPRALQPNPTVWHRSATRSERCQRPKRRV